MATVGSVNILLDAKDFCESETPSVERFYMVYGIGRGAPSYRHPTKESAHNEAKRLSEANPGTSYVVLKATKAYHASKPIARQFDLDEPENDGPFF